MINLLIDLNNIVHRSIFIVGGYGSKTFTFEHQSELDQLMRKMAIDIAFIIRNTNPSRVIFCQDDSSWRKSIDIEENEGYKGNRIKTKIINWNNVYNAIDEFTEILQTYGMIVTKIANAEADDVIAMWTKELADVQNQHVVIVSGDEDLRQLVRTQNIEKGKESFVTVYNPFMQGKNAFRKLYVTPEFETWVNTADEVDFFNMRGTVNVDKEDFKQTITAERTKYEVVDGNMIALRKVFCGDDGDNIPSFHTWLNDKEKVLRVTNSRFEKMLELIKQSSNISSIFPETLLKLSKEIENAFVQVFKFTPPFNVYERILRQIRLVVLDEQFFPEEILNDFISIKEVELEKPRVNLINLNMHNLLEGTRYLDKKPGQSEASIFKQIDRIQGKSLF